MNEMIIGNPEGFAKALANRTLMPFIALIIAADVLKKKDIKKNSPLAKMIIKAVRNMGKE